MEGKEREGAKKEPVPNKILQRMLERLFAALVNGPSLNARPHSSRQRIDLTQLAKLGDRSAEDVLRELLDEKHACRLVARIPIPPHASPKKRGGNGATEGHGAGADEAEAKLTPEEKRAKEA